ncbi:MAG: MYXO-CTERM sorting domain-containing protein, partial [Myxococcales bacterium]|nr:MYXO-CTERM sorting domain-containing protein [Myxococcales bacterium]
GGGDGGTDGAGIAGHGGSGCGCALSGRGAQPLPWLVAIVGLAAFAARRRR